jgi:flavin-binding protein dodecin
VARRLAQGEWPLGGFRARVRWSPGSATGAIAKALQRAGYHRIAKVQRFIVKGTYGPLADGEVERAKAWGKELARLCKAG